MPLFGLVGYPVAHSSSPAFFAERFRELGLNQCTYRLFPLRSVDQLSSLLEAHPDLRGFNVTIPHKSAIIPLLSCLDPGATEIRAVNTVVVRKEAGMRILTGYNTDAEGFRLSADFSGHSRALVLGTGGSSAAVSRVLQHAAIGVTRVSRTPTAPGCISYSDINETVMQSHTLIVNTTPLGMSPETDVAPPIPYSLIRPGHFLYDLVYNPAETLFLRKGRVQGATVQSGESMFRHQANLALCLFRTALQNE